MSRAESVVVTFPDGTKRSLPSETTVGAALEAWGPTQMSGVLAAVRNGRPVDLASKVGEGGAVAPLTFADAKGREILQHSAAHVVAKALVEVVPSALPTVGPPTEDGFYYDFDVRPLTPSDIESVEERIGRAIREVDPFERVEVSKSEALKLVAGNRHKEAIVAEVPEDAPVSFYRTGGFLDLCRGPHVPHTGWLKGTKLLGFSGITAGGLPDGEPRQRIRGISFPTSDELDAYLKLRAEAVARDHRDLGAKLELFTFVDECPGFPFWLPNGMVVVRELERFVTEHFAADGYVEIRTPMLYAQSVFETSGHWEHFRDNMFLSEVDDRTFGIKPMNCPGAMLVYRSRARSYRELPLRLAEFAPLHRREASGTLHGLTRVREFVQDDAHLFVTEEQIESEVRKLLDWIQRAFSTFELSWSCELSTRPDAYLGEAAQWDRAEATLQAVLKNSGVPFRVSPGEGAFYGPKIDIQIRDSLGRPWQTGTIQLDYQIPQRFGLEYQGADGRMHVPVVIHRTIFGTWERFLGVLIEHCAGKLPPWLMPVQVRVLPVADRHEKAAEDLVNLLGKHQIRSGISPSSETISKRVRAAELDRIPYVAVLGDSEATTGSVALRVRGTKGQRSIPQADLLQEIGKKIRSRSYLA